MKRIILFTAAICFSIGLQAQEDNSGNYVEVLRSVLSTEKKAAVAEVMQFTKEESDAFWPIYNELQSKLYDVYSKRIDLIQAFGDNYDKMTDEKAMELNKQFLDIITQEDKVYRSFLGKFQKAIGGKKTLRYYQTENKISIMVEYELASRIPLLE